jgi:hypothetical protein
LTLFPVPQSPHKGVIDGVAEAITEAGGDAEEWKQRD